MHLKILKPCEPAHPLQVVSYWVHHRSRSQIASDQRSQPFADSSIARNPAERERERYFWCPIAIRSRLQILGFPIAIRSPSEAPFKHDNRSRDQSFEIRIAIAIATSIARSGALRPRPYDPDMLQNVQKCLLAPPALDPAKSPKISGIVQKVSGKRWEHLFRLFPKLFEDFSGFPPEPEAFGDILDFRLGSETPVSTIVTNI